MKENKYTICVNSRETANAIQRSINYAILTYGCATVADVKDLIGETSEYNDGRFGWVNIPLVAIKERGDDIIEMEFPTPVPLDPEPKEMVDHPSHYQSKTGLEAWDVIEAFTSDLEGIEAFDTGNVLKYMCRWKGKNGLEDLKKAKRYLEHLIDHVENSKKENDLS